MTGYLGIPREKIRVVPLGINIDGHSAAAARRANRRSRSATSRASRRRRACTCCARPTAACANAARRARPRLLAAGYLLDGASRLPRGDPPPDARVGTRRRVRLPRRGRSRAEDRVPAVAGRVLDAGDVRRAEGHVPARGAWPTACRSCSRAAARSPRSSRRPGGGLLVEAGRSDGARRRAAWSSGAIAIAPRRSGAPAPPACASTTASGGWRRPPSAPTESIRGAH